ncbi:hypothetical protein [Aquabacterium sp.]|uniref:hypothetical protein n=1 Tax=Aquabacterium sp. TaxID=1872578 RepID=UPI002E3750DB|nr:hypothetical protein [Aquabacterium sp.]HEX5312697.1 hypothetical protein [Aquabacterium sp.]
MTVKHIFWGLLLMVLASMGWRYKNADAVQNLVNPPPSPAAAIEFDNMPPPSAGPAPATGESLAPRPPVVTRVAGAMRKCKKGREITYTDGDCPAGSKEFGVQGGSVTVVPSPSATAAPEKDGAPRANVRNLLVDPEKDAELRNKRMDRIVNP